MTAPLRVHHTKDSPGIVWIETAVDQAFRKALLDGVPVSLRSKMNEALAVIPDKGAMAHSVRYFGAELADIKNRIAPLLIELDRFLSATYGLPSLFDWLLQTNYGNDYRMIKAFAAWADMEIKGRASSRPGLITNLAEPNG